ncbi:MAG: FtsX-like permease family protein [Burkholderiales bacterium]
MHPPDRLTPIGVMRLSWRMLLRDWRAGELRVLAAALVIAVASLTTVAFFADRVGRTIEREANQLLGADLVVVSRQPIDAGFEAEAQRLGLATTTAVRFPSMVQFADESLLTEIKAVEAGYPLRGKLLIRSQIDAPEVEPGVIPRAGAVWADDRLLRRLGVNIGDTIGLGTQSFAVTAMVSEEPESSAGFLNLGPRLMLNRADLESTGLIGYGSRVNYRLFVAGDEQPLAAFRDFAESRIVPGQRLESIRDARPEINAAMDRAERFLRLSALLTVILAGVAVALAARRHLQRHLDACAVMRCLGATQELILGLHALQFAIAGLIASAIGCTLGFVCQYALAAVLAPVVGVELPPPGWLPVAQGFTAGFVLLLGFALPPLIALRRVPTLRVLRRDIGTPDTVGWSAYLLGGVAMAGLILWQAQEIRLGLYMLGGVLGTMAVSALVTVAAIWLLAKAVSRAGFSWRFGLANLRRRTVGSVIQVIALGLGLMALILLTLVRSDLLASWQSSLPPDAPNRFLVNIQPDQTEAIDAFFDSRGFETPVFYPMVRARLTRINGLEVASADYEDDRARRLTDREFNLSWATRMQPDNTIVAGRWFAPGETGSNAVSVEEGIAQTLGLRLGDMLTYNVAGETLDVEITSLRKVEWDSFRVNFFVVAAPGLLENYPASYVTSFYLPAERDSLMDEIVRAFPNLLVIDVAAILAQVQRMMDQVVRAVEFVFLFSLAAGLLVLFAAVSATHDERVFDAAVMRTLGAAASQLRAVQIAEFLFIGALAGLLAALGATGVGWVLAHKVLNVPFAINPVVWAIGLVAGAAGVTVAGLLGTAKVLRTPPMQVFRTAG